MDLNQKKVFITGGSSGIGKATAKLLAEAGAKVVITGRNKEKLEAVAKEINCIPLQMEMTDYAAIPAKAKEALELLGGLDILINNAGHGAFTTLGNIKLEDFESIFGANVFGLAMLTQEFIPLFTEQSSGDIINIASTASLKGFAHGTVYSASKFAVRGMTQCWQAELRKHNVRVILVNPSEVTTAFANEERTERAAEASKLRPIEIAHTIKATLEMDRRGFIPEVTVWATNPQSGLGG